MPSNALPSADKALSVYAYFRLYQGALRIDNTRSRLVACTIILLSGRLGLRLQEIQHLREEWIDWKWGVIRIPNHDPCGCKRCWTSAFDMWGRVGLKELQENDEWDSDASWKNLQAPEREEVVERADCCTIENLEEMLYTNRWQPKYNRSARVVPFGWSERITACLMRFFNEYDYIDYQQFPASRLVKRAARNADGLDPNEISPHPLRATGITFWADVSVDPKMLRDLAGWQNIQTAVRYLRVSGHLTTHKVYDLLGKGTEVPPVVPSEPTERFPVACNPVPFENEPFVAMTPHGDHCDHEARMGRHLEQQDQRVPLIHPRDPNLPHGQAGFPDQTELSYDPSRHDLPGHFDRDSDRVEIKDGQPMALVSTIADTEDVHRVDSDAHAKSQAHRADGVNAHISDYHDYQDSNQTTVTTPIGAALVCSSVMQSRLHKEWSDFWVAGDGSKPSAERLLKGTAAYILLVIFPASLNFSLLF